MKTNAVYLGIDVSKHKLHVASPDRLIGEFPNSCSGHQSLIARLQTLRPQLIVLEASGGYERLVCEALQDAALPVNVSQPSSVRYFGLSQRVLAKTDQIDAKVIAQFAEATKPRVTPKTPQNVRRIRALQTRRQQIIDDRVQEQGRLESCADKQIATQMRAAIRRLQSIEKTLDQQILKLRKSDAEFNKKSQVLLQQVGVGDGTVAALLSYCPELGTMNRKQIAALAGIAPYARESGTWKGKRRIFAGRAALRKAMYLAARTAARLCPVIRPFYERLRDAGKCYKVAIIACARKMLIHLNSIMKPFHEQHDNTTVLA